MALKGWTKAELTNTRYSKAGTNKKKIKNENGLSL